MISRCLHLTVAIGFAAGGLTACQPADSGETVDSASETAAGLPSGAHVVEVTARDFAFEAPAEIPHGWNTFRMRNTGAQHHFLVLWRLPEHKTFEDYAREVVTPFDTLGAQYQAGALDRAELMQALGATLPDWFTAEGFGGPGLTAPGGVTETIVKLEPGTYAMECYVRTPEGRFHNVLGMMRPITVTGDSTGASPPEADLEMTLSNYEITTEGPLWPGEHTVRVHVAEAPEGLLGHDIHLARLEDGTSVQAVAKWMDWVDEFQDPPPATFLGGAEQVPAGHTTYFTVDLEPGRYAWISEGYAHQGMVKEFTIK